MASEPNRCPSCGLELPANAPEGECPRCPTLRAMTGDPPAPADPDATTAPPAPGSGHSPALTQADAEATGAYIPRPVGDATQDLDNATLARTSDPHDPAETTDGDAPSRDLPRGTTVRYFGDYEIQKELGRGGMGVVYKARQVSLNRAVALKMIKAGFLADEAEQRRFQNEAEAVALLDHAGIVPVYEVGEYDGHRYFSMKLVEGGNLAEHLASLKDNPRAAATLLAETAEAVHHAHMRGILHRDLKPANILIDAEGHPHVTDFGLAKRVEADIEFTQSGAILGTPAYMSPEQAAGRRGTITTATDIYGLGAILYAVLTGKAPFGGDSLAETMDAVRTRPPEPPAKLNAKVPRDLETICLKCLEKDPRRRYVSAHELANDLDNWLDSRPISARRVGTAERAWLWCKRRPALAGLSAALAAALIVGVIGVTWQWREAVFQRNAAVAAREISAREEAAARQAEGEARAARDAAQAARIQAEQNAQLAGMQATLALNTIQDFVSQVQTGLNAPGLFDFKKSLLDTALKRMDGVAAVYEKSTSKEATVLAALMELAKIYRDLGQSEKGFKTLERCLEIARERVKIKQGSDPSRQNLANVYRELALRSEEFRRDMKAALRYNEESLAIWDDVYQKPKDDGFALRKTIVRYFLAEAYTRVGVGRYRIGEVARAREDFLKAYNLRGELVAEMKDDPQMKQDLSFSTMALAETSFRLGDRTRADEYYRRALDQREKMFEARPKDPRVRSQLADVNYMIGEFKLKIGDHAEARRRLQKSRDLRAGLAGGDEKNTIYRRNLAVSLYRLGNLADRENNPRAAAEAFEASRSISQGLVDLDEHNDKRLYELMPTLAHTGKVDAAAEIADRFGAGPNLDNELRLEIARCYAQCARHTPPDQAEKSQTFLVKAVATLRKAIDDGFKDYVYVESEPDLDPLRSRDDFKGLLAKISPKP